MTLRSAALLNLRQDARGAISILGLFFVLLCTGLVFGIWGIVRTILQREGLQDAADAAVFSSAVLHARGMNLIVFINWVMAALVAVLIALRLAQALCIMGAFLCAAMAFVTMGATAAFIPPLQTAATQLENAYGRAKRVIFPMLSALNKTERAAASIVPLVATTGSVIEATKHHPEAEFALALPGSLRLPVEPDEFPVLCGKGGRLAASLALAPLSFLGSKDGGVLGALVDAVEELAKATSGFLCGDGSGTPPSHTETREETHPEPPELVSCKETGNGDDCREAESVLERAVPAENGECPSHGCERNHPYVLQNEAARVACQPGHLGEVLDYNWQYREMEAEFERIGSRWIEVEGSRRATRSDYVQGDPNPPCGPQGTVQRDTWNIHPGPYQWDRDPRPVCSTFRAPSGPGVPGARRPVMWIEATRVFSCRIEISKEIPLADGKDAFGKQGSTNRSPHRVQKVEEDGEKVSLKLGSEPFRIRGVAVGDAPHLGPAEGFVRLAERRKLGPTQAEDGAGLAQSDLAAFQSTLGALGVAQAEYYFDHPGDTPPEEWMWGFRWKARLTRFALPSDEDKQIERRTQSQQPPQGDEPKGLEDRSVAEECRAQRARKDETNAQSDSTTSGGSAAGSGQCEDIEGQLEGLNGIILH